MGWQHCRIQEPLEEEDDCSRQCLKQYRHVRGYELESQYGWITVLEKYNDYDLHNIDPYWGVSWVWSERHNDRSQLKL